jgi:hypothetical protein
MQVNAQVVEMKLLPHELQRLVVLASEKRWDELLEQLNTSSQYPVEYWSQLLCELCEFGQIAWLPFVLSRGADPSYRNSVGDTPLSQCLAGSARRRPTFQTFWSLLQAGADPNRIG